jgi:hypothetical protein
MPALPAVLEDPPMPPRLAILPVLLLANACAPEIDPITRLANRCSVAVADRGLQVGGFNRLVSRTFTDGELAAWAGIASPRVPVLNTRGLPVAEASALDGGVPGAAWQACMQRNMRALT